MLQSPPTSNLVAIPRGFSWDESFPVTSEAPRDEPHVVLCRVGLEALGLMGPAHQQPSIRLSSPSPPLGASSAPPPPPGAPRQRSSPGTTPPHSSPARRRRSPVVPLRAPAALIMGGFFSAWGGPDFCASIPGPFGENL